jgi:hypothetical protein
MLLEILLLIVLLLFYYHYSHIKIPSSVYDMGIPIRDKTKSILTKK